MLHELSARAGGAILRSVGALLLVAALGACDGQGAVGNPSMFTDANDGTNWPSYGRTYDESHYSPLDEVNVDTIGTLGLVSYADLPNALSVSAPLAVDGVVYITSGYSVLRAIDPRTGKVLWTYDPKVPQVAGQLMRTTWGPRGLAYWNGKVLVGTTDGRLIAVNARDGTLAWSTQTLRPGDRAVISGAPRVYNGKVIIGNGGADFSPVRGYVTCYDAETGKQLWRFFTVPGDPAKGFEDKTMEMAARTWSQEGLWKEGGGGTVWNAITYDPEFNRVYVGTGNGYPWNKKLRSPGGGDNLFLASIVALDADTGRYVWHYQANPGEQWDFNNAMDIQTATLTIHGKPRKVLMHAPKNGFFYVIDRENGKLISAEPFSQVTWAKGIDLKTGRPIEAPGIRPLDNQVMIYPGSLGAHNWQPMSFSHKTGFVYIPTADVPGVYDDRGIVKGKWVLDTASLGSSGVGYQTLDYNTPAPPADVRMGSLQAYDPVTQKQVWSVKQRSPYNGGVMSTGGNLVFQGDVSGRFKAYDAATGKEVWSFDAHAGVLASPISYQVDGKQYVTVITGMSRTPAILGHLAAENGWTYRGQKRRVLTFALGGAVKLPTGEGEGPMKETPLAAPDFKVDPKLASTGMYKFTNYCLTCHGAGAVAGGSAPDLRASPAVLDWATFNSIVREGSLLDAGMPKFADISEQDLREIQHYIRQQARP